MQMFGLIFKREKIRFANPSLSMGGFQNNLFVQKCNNIPTKSEQAL